MYTFGYGRVSTKEQTTENQRLEIEKAGYKVDAWFSDEGISGMSYASQRPQFKALMSKIRDGESLIVTKVDRLGRNAGDIAATIKLLTDKQIKVIILQLGSIDMTSPMGKLVLNVMAALAEMERDMLVERTQAGLERAKREGKVLGRKRSTTPEQNAQIIHLRKIGARASDLARLFKVSHQTIGRIIKAA